MKRISFIILSSLIGASCAHDQVFAESQFFSEKHQQFIQQYVTQTEKTPEAYNDRELDFCKHVMNKLISKGDSDLFSFKIFADHDGFIALEKVYQHCLLDKDLALYLQQVKSNTTKKSLSLFLCKAWTLLYKERKTETAEKIAYEYALLALCLLADFDKQEELMPILQKSLFDGVRISTAATLLLKSKAQQTQNASH
jgi:hypothetical protein